MTEDELLLKDALDGAIEVAKSGERGVGYQILGRLLKDFSERSSAIDMIIKDVLVPAVKDDSNSLQNRLNWIWTTNYLIQKQIYLHNLLKRLDLATNTTLYELTGIITHLFGKNFEKAVYEKIIHYELLSEQLEKLKKPLICLKIFNETGELIVTEQNVEFISEDIAIIDKTIKDILFPIAKNALESLQKRFNCVCTIIYLMENQITLCNLLRKNDESTNEKIMICKHLIVQLKDLKSAMSLTETVENPEKLSAINKMLK